MKNRLHVKQIITAGLCLLVFFALPTLPSEKGKVRVICYLFVDDIEQILYECSNRNFTMYIVIG
jgi:uncharacterized membrane protein